jgi:uncharacterized protein YeaO (DUF488 family)
MGGPGKATSTPIELKRAYDQAAETDGYRVLVDRVWPRGVTKHDPPVDVWLEDLAPSTALRKWFRARSDEVGRVQEALRFRARAACGPARTARRESENRALTLVFGARDAK